MTEEWVRSECTVYRAILIFVFLVEVMPLWGGWAARELAKIRSARFDPEQCYRVRDLFLEREEAKFYFSDGHLILVRPLAGRTFAALFVATDPADSGEVILFPPSKKERQSLTRFASQPVLHEKFRTAMMFFSDDTGERLHEALIDNPGPKSWRL